MAEPMPSKLEASAMIGRMPIPGTHGILAIVLEPGEKSTGVKMGYLVAEDLLLRCSLTGFKQTPVEIVALLRAAVDSLEQQVQAAGKLGQGGGNRA